jgi:hypothetical protein
LIIKIERSGGLAGLHASTEIDAKDLPPQLVTMAKKIMNAKISPHPLKTKPIGAADHYNFKISIYEGERRKVIECTQYDIQDELKSLVNYIEKSSKSDK